MTSDTAIAAQYPRHCSFNEGDWHILSQHWFPVAAASSIAAGPVAVTLLDVALVAYRTGGAIRIVQDVCPHRSVPLSMGKVVGDDLICAYHGLHYGPDGQCRKIPAQPDIKPPSRFRLTLARIQCANIRRRPGHRGTPGPRGNTLAGRG